MLNKSYDGIIFDLDGTMWDTRKPICEAWNIILSRHEEIHRAPIVEADLNDCMGLPMYDIAAKAVSTRTGTGKKCTYGRAVYI